ncbi:MAG: hypothetical protein Q4C64_03790 [Erysipelotrichia bacterium]|nr:hypothetical protein [Erysipelotrichia bacterium]
MRLRIEKSILNGDVIAPASKSVTHRVLIASALSRKLCHVENIVYSEDVCATLDCLKQLNCEVTENYDSVEINGENIFKQINGDLNCRESGSTLRFLIPVALLTNKYITFTGSERLLERPINDYEQLCQENNFFFEKKVNKITVKGKLQPQMYQLIGNSSSQFASGMLLALSALSGKSIIKINKNLQSKAYIELTKTVLDKFGVNIILTDELISIDSQGYTAQNWKIEADMSNSAYLYCYNYLGGNVDILNDNPDSMQKDKVFHYLFKKICQGKPIIDVADCPDLAPILISLAAVKNGVILLNTARLAIKESNRSLAMQEELAKFGVNIIVEENKIIVPKTELIKPKEIIESHNDHRIVMALMPLLTLTSGKMNNAEAVNKSFPNYFKLLQQLGCKLYREE